MHCHSHRPEIRHLEDGADDIAAEILPGTMGQPYARFELITAGKKAGRQRRGYLIWRGVVLTSKIRSFQIGIPSFVMGAGKENPVE